MLWVFLKAMTLACDLMRNGASVRHKAFPSGSSCTVFCGSHLLAPGLLAWHQIRNASWYCISGQYPTPLGLKRLDGIGLLICSHTTRKMEEVEEAD
jgi:hypothetical protein